eukprot:gene10333-12686_t
MNNHSKSNVRDLEMPPSISEPTSITSSTKTLPPTTTTTVAKTKIPNYNQIKQIDVVLLDLNGTKNGGLFQVNNEFFSRTGMVQPIFQTYIDKLVGNRLDIHTAVGLVCVSDTIDLKVGISQNYNQFSKEVREVYESALKETRLCEGILFAAKEIVKFRDNLTEIIEIAPPDELICRIFTLTNGCGSLHLEPFFTYEYLKENRIIIDCISLNDKDPQLEILRSFSEGTGGSCFLFKNPSQVISLFESEALLCPNLRENFKPFSKPISNLEELLALGEKAKILTTIGKQESRIEASGKYISNVFFPVAPSPQSSKEGTQYPFPARMKRIIGEYKSFIKQFENDSDPEYRVYVSESDFTNWKIILKGPKGTKYEGGSWVLSVTFPEMFPFVHPTVRFLTKIYHVNVNCDGKICMDIFNAHWSAPISMLKVMTLISELLSTPDISHSFDSVKSSEYIDRDQYNQNIAQWVKEYASLGVDQLKVLHNLE